MDFRTKIKNGRIQIPEEILTKIDIGEKEELKIPSLPIKTIKFLLEQ